MTHTVDLFDLPTVLTRNWKAIYLLERLNCALKIKWQLQYIRLLLILAPNSGHSVLTVLNS